jgi:hypothetical protein
VTLPPAQKVNGPLALIVGAAGVAGCAFIITDPVDADEHVAVATLKVYVPAAIPLQVKVVPDNPFWEPGDVPARSKLYVPVGGRPVNGTLPVGKVHVG